MEQKMNDSSPIKRETISKQVYNFLLDSILRGKIKPENRLIERDIATKLGVSRVPVREAFLMLENSGLMRSIKPKGRVVVNISSKKVSELYEVVILLEIYGAKIGCYKDNPKNIKEFQSLIERMATCAQTNNIFEYYKLNFEFHRRMVASSGNETLLDIYEIVDRQIHWCQELTLRKTINLDLSLKEHTMIYHAFIGRDVNSFEKHIRKHRERAAKAVIKYIKLK